jgi:coenzyme Q-binding protein COQ10
MPTHAEKRILPYLPEQIFDLVANVERYPEFLPWVISTQIINRQENSFVADLTVGYKFISDSYRSEVVLYPHHRIDINYVNGPFKYLNNHWIFSQYDEKHVEVDFYIDFEFKSSVLQGMMQTVFSEVVKRMIQSFEKRAAEIY